MNFKITKMCRGCGVAYFLAEIDGVATENLSFESRSEMGLSLPVEVYEYDGEDSNKMQYILASPLLDTQKITFIANDNLSGESSEKTISRFMLKWLSRLNYRLDYETASRLRDVDRLTYSNQIHINLSFYSNVEAKKEILIKGIVCTPACENEAICIEVLNGNGSVLEAPNLYVYKSKNVDYEGLSRIEIPFTLRLPNDGKVYCIVAKGRNGSRSGFLCLDQDSKEWYGATKGCLDYPSARPGAWNGVMAHHNRKYQNASIEDYAVEGGPLFSIVVPLYNTPISFFNEMVTSVRGQLYQNWELILVNSTPDNRELAASLESIDDRRVRIIVLDENKGISENTNIGVDAAKGDYIIYFDHDDVLDKLVLARYASVIAGNNIVDVLYCDEDLLAPDGSYISPHFKSDFNIDLLRCHNYITHLLCVRSNLAKTHKLRKQFDGAQDYDLILRLSEITNNIVHIPEVLYHWRVSEASTAGGAAAKTYAQTAGHNALEEHLRRQKLDAIVRDSEIPFHYRVEYEVKDQPLVSILIPNKDNADVLSRCLESIFEKTTYPNLEIIVIENNSKLPETFAYYEKAKKSYDSLKVVNWEGEFNYSAINNYGASFAKGDYFLLLNNDTEVISPNWIESMVGFCQREDVGVVGAKLLYPDDTVQHVGVAMSYCPGPSVMGGPFHVFANIDETDPGYMWRALYSQDVSMVTGACLMTKREIFEQLSGLSERYKVAYNDVDYCLKVREANKLVVFDANVKLYHYESFSRGSDMEKTKIQRFVSEQGKLRADWPNWFVDPDPYYGSRVNV